MFSFAVYGICEYNFDNLLIGQEAGQTESGWVGSGQVK